MCWRIWRWSMSKALRLAVTKGRLLKKSIEMMEAVGFDCSAVREPGRRLILPVLDKAGHIYCEVVLAKARDVITYVEHGVCDLGIVGKDSILEWGRSFYEVLDLGFGACRFALAVKQGEDFYGKLHHRVVASKYTNVTARYFQQQGVDVEIIHIDGSVELAPILGLADGIVDIVETGDTLRENGLVPIETVAQISARLIVNVGSMKTKHSDVRGFVENCEAALGR